MFETKLSFRLAPTTICLVCCLLVSIRSSPLVECNDGDDFNDGQLWLNRNDLPEQPSEKLAELLGRVGPNMRAAADYHDFKDVNLNESIEAWRLLHERTRKFAKNQVEFYKPRLIQLVKNSNVTLNCLESMNFVLDSIERLDSWAVKMWNFNGNFPPAGLFDGQFSDLGSYRGCVDLEVPLDEGGGSPRRLYDHANYCVLAFRPIVPSRRRFHQIFQKEHESFLNIFNRSDIFSSMLQFSHYFHYVYMKTGVCLSSQCSPQDMQSVAHSIGQKLALMPGPVKCFTRSKATLVNRTTTDNLENLSGRIENEPVLVYLGERMNMSQLVSIVIVGAFFSLVFLATIWHSIELLWSKFSQKQDDQYDDDLSIDARDKEEVATHSNSIYTKSVETGQVKHVAFYYFSMLTNGEEFFQTKSTRPDEIRCLHGLRAITMSWIICVHTLQYSEWSGFTRIFENVASLQDPLLHPILNANNAVDTFFLMSGLLVAYTNWSPKKMEAYQTQANSSSSRNKFSIFVSLLGRYLRLTPQVMLVSLFYILMPLVGDGPFWFDMTHYASKYCEKNWWVNLLHLQAFYRDDEMCNLVSWWISVDMLYYALAVLLLWLLFNRQKGLAVFATVAYVGCCLAVTCFRHYTGGYTPNNLGTVPQVAEVWTWFVINFSWSPYSHAYVFFFGFWAGYILTLNKWRREVRKWSRVGWILAGLSLLAINYSSHLWMSSTLELDNQTISTAYNVVCQIAWTNAVSWLIVACHYGCLPNLNRFLSTKMAVILSKASFIVYLSHMLIIRSIYGSRYHVLEVSVMTITLLMLGMIVISSCFGIFLAISFEGPCMKFQRYVTCSIRSASKDNQQADNHKVKNGNKSFGVILL